ncbi:hypothetical protein TraAM80_03616 [Trypanosoma rangeli]|uniref:Uncharacterized protein n=1 Tax=Trypanosoma rangeli TaxID=5698 RepID=A0A422NNE3_TRYRA|nr:uncharacterized protein TraAM80_03616 [Trypanosoma rangeli]RNF07003.1 hypothetical protein TraAM80_03616 [Trypanosoma rangeli]|eukprot:RNF07003.1 hypothetical protein TraAM80_03616 [Trypanosoma rangeli]
MRGTLPQKHSSAKLAASLHGIRRQADLLLLARHFHKVRTYVQLQQQSTHLKRCAVLLKHQATRKMVMDYFIRWLGFTQRQVSIRSGQRVPTKIVLLPRAQDFINLGRRYLARWRLWLRRQRQRRQKNVALLHSKLTETQQREIFCQWCYFIFQKQRKTFTSWISELECSSKRQTEHIAQLEAELQQHQSTIKKLKKDAEKLQVRNMEQQKKLTDINTAAETVIKRFSRTSAKVTYDAMTHATKKTIQQGGELPFRLLTEFEDVADVLEKLRRTLPEDAVPLTGFKAVVEFACQRATEMNDTVAQLKEALHDTKSVAVFVFRVLQEGASRILALANQTSLAESPSVVAAVEEMSWPLLRWDSYSDSAVLEESLGGRESLKVIQDHLLREHRLVADGPSTASVLQLFCGALGQMHETLTKCESRFLEQKGLAEREREKKMILAKAVKDAVAVLQGWSAAPTGAVPGGMKEQQLATEMLRESEAAANTFAHLRQLLSWESVRKNQLPSTGINDSCGGNFPFLQVSVIETHDHLVNAVFQVFNRLKEVSKAYNEVYLEFRQFFPDSPRTDNNVRGNLNILAPLAGFRDDPVKWAEVVVRSVKGYIRGKEKEVRELRGVMRRGIEALGGTEETDSDDDIMDQERSAVKSARVGEKLALICRDTGDAISTARVALGVQEEGKLTLSQVIPNLKEKMCELKVVMTESAALIDEVKVSLTATSQKCPLNLSRCLKPKRKPVALVVNNLEVRKLDHVKVSSPMAGSISQEPVEILRELRRVMQDKTFEMRELQGACQTILRILDGVYLVKADLPQCGDLLLPLLAAQAEELKRGLRVAEAALSASGMHGNRSVGNFLTLLASNVSSLRTENEALQDEVSQRIKQIKYLMTELTEDSACLKAQNNVLNAMVKSLREKFMMQKRMGKLRAEKMMEILRLRTVKEHLCRRLLVWFGHVVVMRSTEACGAANEQKRLSFEVVHKQHQQNQLAKLLATALHSLPGEASRNSDVLDTEYTLMRRVLECEGAALEVLVRERLDAAKAWMRSLLSVLSAVAPLRAETVALRQLVASAWGGNVEEEYRRILVDAFKSIVTFDEEKERGCAFLWNCVRDRDEVERANIDLVNKVMELKEELKGVQVHIVLQDEQIIKLQRENRDLQINGVMCRDADANNTFNAVTPSSNLHTRPEAECLMLARSKKLLLEAIKAMAGKDLAVCIGEVAELTLEMYRRTTSALEDICGAQDVTVGPLPARTEARLRELQNMRAVQNDILERLPELFRMPYVS